MRLSLRQPHFFCVKDPEGEVTWEHAIRERPTRTQKMGMRILLLLSLFLIVSKIQAQHSPKDWTVHNREVDFSEEAIHLNAQENDGIL